MKKKILIITFIILLIFIVVKKINYKYTLTSLEKYELVENESIIKKINYNNKEYIISKYYDNTSSWSNLNILLRDNDYYILKKIKKCDTLDDASNLFVNNNEIYIHCIGKVEIDKYTITNLNVAQEKIKFNFENTPNISQLHMTIDKVGNKYIYLSSPSKVDNTIKDAPKVKCSFKEKMCSYVR